MLELEFAEPLSFVKANADVNTRLFRFSPIQGPILEFSEGVETLAGVASDSADVFGVAQKVFCFTSGCTV